MLRAIENSSIVSYIKSSSLLYPFIEILHIIGFTTLVGATIMFDLRLLGISNKLSIAALAKHLLPWSRGSFFLVVPTGLLLFATNADALSKNPVFLLKLFLISVALVNAGIFHFYSLRFIKNDQVISQVPKVNAVASIALWISVIVCGRLLAYV